MKFVCFVLLIHTFAYMICVLWVCSKDPIWYSCGVAKGRELVKKNRWWRGFGKLGQNKKFRAQKEGWGYGLVRIFRAKKIHQKGCLIQVWVADFENSQPMGKHTSVWKFGNGVLGSSGLRTWRGRIVRRAEGGGFIGMRRGGIAGKKKNRAWSKPSNSTAHTQKKIAVCALNSGVIPQKRRKHVHQANSGNKACWWKHAAKNYTNFPRKQCYKLIPATNCDGLCSQKIL